MFDYETLRLVWWLLLAVLAAGFALTAGFDLGAGMLLPYLGRTDTERRIVLNVIGPTWEGNQVWLIVLGGVSFAAWPLVYAAAFSGLYMALMLLLLGLALRPIGFDYRSKIPHQHWRNAWDHGLWLGAFIPALVLSLALGNLLVGLPFDLARFPAVTFSGGFLDLLRPFPMLVAIVGISLFILHGAVYLQWRTITAVAQRARTAVHWSSVVFVIAFILAGLWIATGIEGFRISGEIVPASPSNPLNKTVAHDAGLWLANYQSYPALWFLPALTLAGVVLARIGSQRGLPIAAFAGSTSAVAGAVATAAGAMFPFIMPSVTVPNHSLTAWDASASQHTLQLLTLVTIVFLPIVLAYTVWAYRVIWGQITESHIEADSHSLY